MHESVELVKRSRRTSAAGLVNALLRKVGGTANTQRKIQPEDEQEKDEADTVAAIAVKYAHPEWLVARWLAHFGPETTRAICAEDQRVPAATIRLRHPSDTERSAPFDFVGEDVRLAPGSLLISARRVEAGDITKTKAFRAGHIAIQDEASQLIALLVGQGSRILDACAAPGGKTAILAEQNPSSEIVAVDLHAHRTRLLGERIQAPNIKVVTSDFRHFPIGEPFDRILVDAPCTGTGTMAHHPEIKWRLRPEDLAQLQSLQVSLLTSALQHLAPGGSVFYSTCSLEPEECEQVVDQVLAVQQTFELGDIAAELARLQNEKVLTASPDRLTQGPYLRTFPGVHPCDGFFAALLRRK